MTLICYLLLFLPPGVTTATESAPGPAGGNSGTAVVLVIDRIEAEDLLNADIPNIKKLAGLGAIGLMTTNPATGAARLPENTYTSIGAGFKLKGGEYGGRAYNSTEPFENGTAGEAYFRRTGRIPAPEAVVHLGIVHILKTSSDLKYNFTVGTLGEVLHRIGKKTAVIGNADIYKEVNRHGVNIAMDSMGLVDYGDVSGGTMTGAPDRITGRKPDYRRWLQLFKGLREKAGLIVFETGETSRLDKMTDISIDRAVEQERKEILHELDDFVGELAGLLDFKRDLLMIVVPEPTFAAMKGQNFLTPVIAVGKGINPGLAWSGTVKRKGVVANTDIAPTIAAFFNIRPGQTGNDDLFFNGQALKGQAGIADFAALTELNQKIVGIYMIRYPLVKGYTIFILGILLIVITGLLLGQKFVRWLKPVLVALTAVPLALLLLSLILPKPQLLSGIMAALALSLLITAAGYLLGRKFESGPFIIIALLTAGTIAADLFLGGLLNKTSPLSYDPMTGARFYGLGNEYMGVFIGALIAGMTGFISEFKISPSWSRLILAGTFLTGLYVIAAPQLGTNVGGSIAAVAGFGTTMTVMAGYSFNRRTILTLATGVIVILGVIIFYDMNRSVEVQSHIGRTVSLVRGNGVGELTDIIARKAAMNWKLIRYTTWSWAFITGLSGFIIFNKFRPVVGRKVKNDHLYFYYGMVGISIGAVAALLFNDSGVVAAAMMMVFGAAPYLSLIINREVV